MYYKQTQTTIYHRQLPHAQQTGKRNILIEVLVGKRLMELTLESITIIF